MPESDAVYRARNLLNLVNYQCVEDYFEIFEQVYVDRFERRHTGFNVYCGPRILPWQQKFMENLTRYIIRASFSQERMIYHREVGQVEYQSKDGTQTKVISGVRFCM